MRNLIFALAINLISLGGVVEAQTSPNHVFQKTETIRLLVDELNKANFSKPARDVPIVRQAMPRHVLQMVGDVWRKTQQLRFINGLPTFSLDPIPARLITPADVMARIEKVQEQMIDLMPVYGLTVAPGEPPLPTNKTPKDVYVNLTRLSVALDELGIPATVPNDVYQVAQTVLSDSIELAHASGIPSATAAIEGIPDISGQIPQDAYVGALELLKELQRLSVNVDKYSIKGDVYVPAEQPSQITPNHVLSLLFRARADINAMRVQVGDQKESINAPYEGGKTPSDVVRTIMQAQAVLSLIANS